MEGFGPRIVFWIGNIPVPETVVVTWIIMAVFTIVSILVTRNFERIPKGIQNIVEMLVDTLNNFVRQTMGEDKMSFAPYMGTLFLFLVVGNLIGLIGLRPPTADVNTTFALSILTFILIQFNAIRSSGIGGYLKGFFQPFPFLFPINVLGEIATPISLGFRLFGNIVGGVIIMTLMYGALASLSSMLGLASIPIFQAVIPMPFHAYFDIFSGVLQSFIFVMLTMVFVSNAMD